MRLRHVMAAAAALATVGAAPFLTSLPAGPTHVEVLNAQGAGDCCVPLPVVATSKQPDQGKVFKELGFADLEAMFSNRYVIFGGWEEAFTALTYEIDRTGAYRMREKPAPPIVKQVGLQEGSFSRELIKPPAPGAPPDNRMTGNPSRWARMGLGNGAAITSALIYTIARTNKYGEPVAGLRKASLAAARFMIDGLATIPLDLALRDNVALRLRGESDNARMIVALWNATPDFIKRSASGPLLPGQQPNDLKLTVFDYANALFDVYRSVDEDGRESGIYSLRQDDREEQLFTPLIVLASARQFFGGTAAPGSPEDSIACRAFSLLVQLAHPDTKGSAALRRQLLNAYAHEVALGTANPQKQAVLKTALIMAGVETPDEAARLVTSILEIGLTARQETMDHAIAQTVSTLLGLIHSAGAARRPTQRQAIADAVKAGFDALIKRNEGNTVVGSEVERRLRDAWLAGGTAAETAQVNPVCSSDSGESKGKIFLYAVTNRGLQQILHPYVGVPMVIEAQYDPPTGEAEMTLDVSIGGETKTLVFKRVDPIGYIYRSDPIVPGGGK